MWEIDLLGQCITGLYAAAVGFCFAVFYDIFKAVRKIVDCKILSIFIQDVIISLVLTLFTFILLIARCNGEVRAYVFVFEFIGFVVFRLAFSRYFLKITVKLIKLVLKINELYSSKILLLSSLIVSLWAKLSDFLKKIAKKCLIKRKNS